MTNKQKIKKTKIPKYVGQEFPIKYSLFSCQEIPIRKFCFRIGENIHRIIEEMKKDNVAF